MSATSDEVEPVDTIVELLDEEPSGSWTNADPLVEPWEEVSQKTKENNNDPTIYVWMPVDTDLSEFDAEGSRQIDEPTVEVHIWTLNRTQTAQYARNVRDILEGYMRDNYSNTEWHKIRPENMNDNRSEKIFRQTDHYTYTVQVELRDLRETGL